MITNISKFEVLYYVVWFKEAFPKHAFTMWVTNYDRLSTRARLVLWGLPIPVSCPLCNTAPETRDHLFLSCQYNNDVWSQDFTRCGPPHQSSASGRILPIEAKK